jgi:hypothetical protein
MMKSPSRPQYGNAAWKAVMKAHEWKKGHAGMRKCTAIARWRGERCGKIAMRGVSVCHTHGGWGLQAAKKVREAIRNGKAVNQANQLRAHYKAAGRR